MSVVNFFPLKLLVAIQVVHTLSKCDAEHTVAEATTKKYFGGFFLVIITIIVVVII